MNGNEYNSKIEVLKNRLLGELERDMYSTVKYTAIEMDELRRVYTREITV